MRMRQHNRHRRRRLYKNEIKRLHLFRHLLHKKMNNDIYIYIHIPYCYKKCPYCAFVSFEKQFSTLDLYINKLIKEIKSFKTAKTVKSIYFGGGTPSTLNPKHIESIINAVYLNFSIDKNPEITFEANPISLKEQYLKSLNSIGINRLSIGIQSFLNKKLKTLGRLHDSSLGENAILKAKEIGFENISLDLIYGLYESKSDIEYELKKVCLLDIQHVSTYMLSVEKGTEFEKRLKNGSLRVSNDDEMADMYLFISEYLTSNGFEHYEISNFAKYGFESRHNCSYWLGYDYRGFGVSASSFIDGIRFSNTDSLKDYLSGKTVVFKEKLSKEDRIKEAFVLMLRTNKGVNIKEFDKMFDTDIKKLYGNTLQKFIDANLIIEKNGNLFLNGAKSMIISNAIFSELI